MREEIGCDLLRREIGSYVGMNQDEDITILLMAPNKDQNVSDINDDVHDSDTLEIWSPRLLTASEKPVKPVTSKPANF